MKMNARPPGLAELHSVEIPSGPTVAYVQKTFNSMVFCLYVSK